jgi:putative protease
LKIEGRVKSEYYVATVVQAYRRAIDAYYQDPEHYKYDPRLYDEIRKVSHRDYYTGFFFGLPKEGAQIFGSSSYIREYDIVGIVREFDPETKIAKVEQRNRFFLGDEIEVMRPMQEYFTQKVTYLKDEDGNDLEAVRHAAMIFYIKLDFDAPIDSMLRKKKDE